MNIDAAQHRDALMPRPPEGMGKGLLLAVLAHVLLIAALSFAVNWRASEPAGVEAELWAALPQVAAPRANEPEPAPAPVKRAAPAVVAPPPPPPAPAPAPRVPDAQIAIEKAEQAKREAARKEEAQRERDRREEAERKQEQREAAQREQQAREKAELERKKKEQAELDRKKKQEAEQQAELERKKKEQAEQQAQALEAQRQANLKRITGMAGASGDERSTGSAMQSAGPSAGYAGRIRARIKPNIVFADTLAGNPVASVEVRVAPDGTITSRRIAKSSGVPAWDEAVLRAIDRTEVLPRDTDGRVPPLMSLEFRPRD